MNKIQLITDDYVNWNDIKIDCECLPVFSIWAFNIDRNNDVDANVLYKSVLKLSESINDLHVSLALKNTPAKTVVLYLQLALVGHSVWVCHKTVDFNDHTKSKEMIELCINSVINCMLGELHITDSFALNVYENVCFA